MLKKLTSYIIISLVHDQPQVVEIEELKIRLKARKEIELKALETEKSNLKTLSIHKSNCENDIKEADEILAIEEGFRFIDKLFTLLH